MNETGCFISNNMKENIAIWIWIISQFWKNSFYFYRNNAGYTANTSRGRVGRGGNAHFRTLNSITTDQPTDRPTDRPTDGWTDKASYRVTSPRLKIIRAGRKILITNLIWITFNFQSNKKKVIKLIILNNFSFFLTCFFLIWQFRSYDQTKMNERNLTSTDAKFLYKYQVMSIF